MTRTFTGTVVTALAAFFLFGLHVPVAAGERGDWFKSLLQPDGTSCCDVSDCAKSEAEWRENHWWAKVHGEWRQVPPDRILSEPYSIDGGAYVCRADPVTDDSKKLKPMIYCFVPPNMGS